jgi:hypothetical protein
MAQHETETARNAIRAFFNEFRHLSRTKCAGHSDSKWLLDPIQLSHPRLLKSTEIQSNFSDCNVPIPDIQMSAKW